MLFSPERGNANERLILQKHGGRSNIVNCIRKQNLAIKWKKENKSHLFVFILASAFGGSNILSFSGNKTFKPSKTYEKLQNK